MPIHNLHVEPDDPVGLFLRWHEAIMLGWVEEYDKTGKIVKLRGKPMRYTDYYPKKLKRLYYSIPSNVRLQYQKMYANLCSVCKNARPLPCKSANGRKLCLPNQKVNRE